MVEKGIIEDMTEIRGRDKVENEIESRTVRKNSTIELRRTGGQEKEEEDRSGIRQNKRKKSMLSKRYER